jgi:hypothetical protein
MRIRVTLGDEGDEGEARDGEDDRDREPDFSPPLFTDGRRICGIS